MTNQTPTEFDWENYHPVEVYRLTLEQVMKAEYLQCQNCDYLGKPKEFPIADGIRCPSCGDDDLVIVDLSKPFYLTRERIIDQIAWQEEIRGKGPVKAIIQHLLKGQKVPHQEAEP